MGSLNSEIESELIKQGACLVGFADMSDLSVDIRGSMRFAISIAVALDASVINEISDGPTGRYYQEYRRVNESLKNLCKHTVHNLKRCGNNAVAIKPTIGKKRLGYKMLATPLPHKTVATRAGLGWIGKSALLITEKYGAAIRIATVLSDAEFEVGEPINSSLCGDCEKCVVHCPAKAILGENWEIGLKRESIYDASACYDTAIKLSKEIGARAILCGICINVCPWTQKYILRVLTN